ncbi:AAA family ATPase [Clostridium ganghwense]|uniref:Nuclease SbcCD subunit C n=1 Tax=Clostridium ganghwense TaxID=312089 RepID=A0ABT4CWL1_9CLOT|nr:AAA family ATPase [Clostridium ganghwense]
MNKLKINKVSMTGFKSYLETKEVALSDFTVINGDNAQGKTTIGEAICWALTGCDLNGNEKATTRLINNTKPKLTEVALDIEFNEEVHTVVRRKRGRCNDFYLDEKKVSTADLAREFFMAKDVFLTIFNPVHFSSMTPKVAKDFLTGVMKEVDKEEILNELGTFIKDRLLKNGFRNSVTFLQDKRSDLDELEKDNIYLEGVIDGQTKIEIPQEKSFDDSELIKLKTKLEELQNEKNEDLGLKELETKLIEFRSSLNVIPFDKPELKDVKGLERTRQDLLSDYKQLKKEYESLEVKTVTCDKCGNEIDINEIERKRLTEKIKAIVAKGKKMAGEIQTAKETNEKLLNEYTEKVNNYRLEIQNEIAKIKEQISKVQEENKKKNEVVEIQKKALKTKIQILEDEQRDVQIFNANIQNLLKQQEQINQKILDSKEELQRNKARKSELKFLIDGAKQFNSIKLKKQSEFIGKYLDKVTLQFEKLTKDGELKDDFKILYEGREFNILSNAERIKAGLEISNLIMNVMDLKLPIFIDNAESITTFNKPDTQLILAKVAEGKKLEIA